MVEIGLATVGEDSGFVHRPVWGIHADWHWTRFGEWFFDTVGIGEHGPWFGRVEEFLGCGDVLAWALDGSVGVLVLEDNTCTVDIVKCPFWPGTTASLALEAFSTTAVHQLLLCEIVESSLGNSDVGFKSSSGWESPAWSALSLILDWVQNILGSPINLGWCLELVGFNSNLDVFFSGDAELFHKNLS